MKAIVTGVAGFVGTTLASRLLDEGYEVLGIDSLTPYYSAWEKFDNLRKNERRAGFTYLHADLRYLDYSAVLDGAELVFHQAAQPGVRASWADFNEYIECNISATYQLLEACRHAKTLKKIIYASSSSVYGDAPRFPTTEFSPTRPRSPYGVTKLAAEDLMTAYAAAWDLPTVSLRYFTVYGPRQRPDMAIRRLAESVLRGQEFPLFGDGGHIRDFTYVDDVVDANVLAASQNLENGEVFNICGGSQISMSELISLIETTSGKTAQIERHPVQRGDVLRTGGSSEKARTLLGWRPNTDLADGIAATLNWLSEKVEADHKS